MKPTPIPIKSPWEMNSCHIRWANDAEMNPIDSNITPITIESSIPSRQFRTIASGLINNAMDKLSPPMRAKSMVCRRKIHR